MILKIYMSNRVAKIILGLTGPLASGKSTVTDYLKEKHSATIYKFSTPLRDILDRIYIEQSRKNLQDLSLDLRNRFGDDLLASITANDVKRDKDNSIIIVDGVRRLPDIKYLRQLPEFKLISIETDQKTRWKRMTMRGENVDDINKTFEQFQKDEQAEAEQKITEVAKTADFQVNNNGTIEDLEEQVEKILTRL